MTPRIPAAATATLRAALTDTGHPNPATTAQRLAAALAADGWTITAPTRPRPRPRPTRPRRRAAIAAALTATLALTALGTAPTAPATTARPTPTTAPATTP